MSVPFQVAVKHGVKLVMYGENGEAEYGGTSRNNDVPGMPWDDFSFYYSCVDDLIEVSKELGHLKSDTPASLMDVYRMPSLSLERLALKCIGLPFIINGSSRKLLLCRREHRFSAKPLEERRHLFEYAQLDDLTDSFLYYMMFIKYGFGRATSDAAHEIRDGHIDRDEAIALVRRYDGEFPAKTFEVFLNYISMTEDEFFEVVDKFRLPHIWEKVSGSWHLKHQL